MNTCMNESIGGDEKGDKGHVILSLSGPIWVTPPDASIWLPPIIVVIWIPCCHNDLHSPSLFFTLSGNWGWHWLTLRFAHELFLHLLTSHPQISYPWKMGGISIVTVSTLFGVETVSTNLRKHRVTNRVWHVQPPRRTPILRIFGNLLVTKQAIH